MQQNTAFILEVCFHLLEIEGNFLEYCPDIQYIFNFYMIILGNFGGANSDIQRSNAN